MLDLGISNPLMIYNQTQALTQSTPDELIRLEAQLLAQDELEKRDPLISIEANYGTDYGALPPKIEKQVGPLLKHLQLKKGDKFNVYYQSGTVRLVRSGKKFVASYNSGLYDHTGFRLDQKQASKAPITLITSVGKAPRISSKYGPRIHPIFKDNRFHAGIDISAPMGSRIHCAFDGKVTKVGYSSIYGTHIVVQHEDSIATLYAHLDSVSVKIGDFLLQGNILGKVGKSGRATGPHLHFEVRKNNKHINPSIIKTVSIRMRDKNALRRFANSLVNQN